MFVGNELQIKKAMYPREPGASLQKSAHTQVTMGARVACYHDEIKLSLPATWTPTHHLLFTFFHVDLQTKLEAPKPVVIGYAALLLSTHAQLKDIVLDLCMMMFWQWLGSSLS